MRSERGQVSIVIIGVLVGGLLAVGLAFDGTRLFIARRDAANLADAAALAAAGAIDRDAFRASDGAVVQLDRDAAVANAREVAAGASIEIAVDADHVDVRIDKAVPMVFLQFLGLQHIAASATARPAAR